MAGAHGRENPDESPTELPRDPQVQNLRQRRVVQQGRKSTIQKVAIPCVSQVQRYRAFSRTRCANTQHTLRQPTPTTN